MTAEHEAPEHGVKLHTNGDDTAEVGVDPADANPWRRCPVSVLKRGDLRPADKLLYLYLADRWRLNHKCPFRAKMTTTMAETGLRRDPYWASLKRLRDAGLILYVRTGRAPLFTLLPLNPDGRGTQLSDERETRRSDGRVSRPSTVQNSSQNPTPDMYPHEQARGRVPKIQKATSTETRVIAPGSVLCPRKSRSSETDEAGRQLLDSHPSGDALVADLEALDYVWLDRSNPGRQAKNRRALYRRLGELGKGGAVDDPVGFVRFALSLVARRRVKLEERTRFAGELIHSGLPEGFKDLYHRYAEEELRSPRAGKTTELMGNVVQ